MNTLPKLGKKPASPCRVPHLYRLRGISTRLATPDISCDRTSLVTSWPMLDNDKIGDCTIAAVGHAEQLLTAMAGDERTMTTTEAIDGYEDFGYDPLDVQPDGSNPTDQGANAQDVLQHWLAPGFQIGGKNDQIAAFCGLDPLNQQEAEQTITWLGVIYLGVALPIAAQGASAWDYDPDRDGPATGNWAPGSWGGHAIPAVAYGPAGLVVVTWGTLLTMSWPFYRQFTDEAYAILTHDEVKSSVPAQTWAELSAAMTVLRGES